VLRRALAGRTVLYSGTVNGLKGRWRILAAPIRVHGTGDAVVLAASLASRDETLDRLIREFLIAGPAALLIAILAGYGLAAAALRPVEAMRRRAASITGSTAGSRLPLPRSRDEVSRLAETLNDMLGRLEAALEHERRFVDDASHELRTPLALLRTELELALRHRRSHAELERALRSAAEETERLSRLAEDLLLVARFDEGVLPVRRETVEARALIEGVAARYESEVQRAGRSFALEAPAGLRLDADSVRLGQALGNLVENAIVHGGGTIGLSARAANGLVELHVTDEGPGIPADFLSRAFDRFSRADDARGRGGTGLGLAIVDVIARAHGGEAGLRNRAGSGADAWIAVGRALSVL
jgi:signal transduction histidine kinase